jgi:hypothetical protein
MFADRSVDVAPECENANRKCVACCHFRHFAVAERSAPDDCGRVGRRQYMLPYVPPPIRDGFQRKF